MAMMYSSASGESTHRSTHGATRALSACGLALLRVIRCLDGVLPSVHYKRVQYLVSSGAKGWEVLSGHDAQGRAFKVHYLRSSGAIPEAPGQHGVAQDMLTSRLPVLGRVIGSDLLAVTRLDSDGVRGTRERHWELSVFAWWVRVLAHVF